MNRGMGNRGVRSLALPLTIAAAALLMSGWLVAQGINANGPAGPESAAGNARATSTFTPDGVPENAATATFAGGCFWCMEPPYDKLDGVYSTVSGYMGGEVENPTYRQVTSGGTGHAEVVQVRYDPDLVSYRELLDVFWRNIDPLTANAQFCDSGSQYRSAIFAHDERQLTLASESKRALEASARFDDPIVTEILAASAFWPAEDYHQNYYQENPVRYKFYRAACGRDNRLEALWGEQAS